MLRAAFVKLQQDGVLYPSCPPFDPPEVYPEFSGVSEKDRIDKGNRIYPAVRQLLLDLGLDRERFNTVLWNPLQEYVRVGGNVVIKPNLVMHRHFSGPEGLHWTITHPSVVRALIDYSWLAVGSSGTVTVVDTPLEDCDFTKLVDGSGYGDMLRDLTARGYRTEILDLRSYCSLNHLDGSNEQITLTGDPRGYTDIDLTETSMFSELEAAHGLQNYYTLGDHTVDHLDISCRARGLPTKNHSLGRHIYRVSNTILNADLSINVAKMKTHKFSGVTLCLKNAIGICNGKEFMPHRRPGTPTEAGDSFPNSPSLHYRWKVRRARVLSRLIGNRLAAAIIEQIRKLIPRPLPHKGMWEPLFGDWSGNDTIWRTTVDLTNIWIKGSLITSTSAPIGRKMLCVIDGVIGMDHEGPMTGMPVNSQVLVIARDPVAADTLGASLMGFDPEKIPTIKKAADLHDAELGMPLSVSEAHGNVMFTAARSSFIPNRGWMSVLGVGRDDQTPKLEKREVSECELG